MSDEEEVILFFDNANNYKNVGNIDVELTILWEAPCLTNSKQDFFNIHKYFILELGRRQT